MYRNDGASSWYILCVGYVLSDSITRNIHLLFLVSDMCRYLYVQDLNYYFCVSCSWFPSSVYLLLILCSLMEEDIYKVILNPLYVSIHLEFLRLTENQTRLCFWRAKHWLCQVFVLLAKCFPSSSTSYMWMSRFSLLLNILVQWHRSAVFQKKIMCLTAMEVISIKLDCLIQFSLCILR